MYENDSYSKIFNNLQDLAKADMSLLEALKAARAHAPEAAKTLARHLYTDSLVPRVGNRMAYNEFLGRHKDSGIHLSLDANSFGAINKEHGFETGNEAIKHLFNTTADVSRQFRR